ncbi:unnamed protein product [Heterosigma akashiwo]
MKHKKLQQPERPKILNKGEIYPVFLLPLCFNSLQHGLCLVTPLFLYPFHELSKFSTRTSIFNHLYCYNGPQSTSDEVICTLNFCANLLFKTFGEQVERDQNSAYN